MPNIATLPDTVLSTATIGAAQIEAGALVTAGLADGSVTGVKASSALRRKVLPKTLPTIPTAAGTTEVLLMVPFTGTIAAARIAFKDALAAHDTNYVTFAIKNKGQAGAGTTDVLSTGDSNTSKVTGGTAIGAYTSRTMNLNGTPANLAVVAGDVLAIQIIGAGTLANTLTLGTVNIGLDVQS